MAGTIERCWLFAYQAPAGAARRFLPAELELVTRGGLAFWNIVVSRIRRMRPRFAPAFAGFSYWHVAYRLHVRFRPPAGEPLEGLWFARSDCDSALLSALGNVMTDFRFHVARIEAAEDEERVSIGVDSAEAPGRAVLDRRAPARLLAHSAFASVGEAAAFLKYQPVGFSVNARRRVNAVRIVRDEAAWRSRVIHVAEEGWRFLEDKDAKLEIAYEVEPIAYVWKRGVIH